MALGNQVDFRAWTHLVQKYPAVPAETGANDPRVEPYTVAKFAAALQAANGGGKPVRLSVNYQSGHGIGDTRAQRVQEVGNELAFILGQTVILGFSRNFNYGSAVAVMASGLLAFTATSMAASNIRQVPRPACFEW